ncbi:MAG: EpsG family protein [Bacteroidales bacterium]
MLIYFIPIIIALIGAFLNGRLTAVSRKLLYIITTVVAIFVYCCVYLNGSDWPNYEEFFNQVTWSNLIQLSSERGFEIGFTFVLFCFKSIGFGFFPFLIVAKSFSLIVISNFFKRYAKEQGQGYSANVFFLLFMFYAGNCMYLYVETIIRFSMALAIVVYAYRFLLNRRFWPYLFYIIIAVTFHRTAILMLPIYFIHRTTIPNKVWIIIFAFLIVLLTPQFLLMFIESISQFIPQIYYIYLKGYMEFAVINGSNILAMLAIIFIQV